MSLICQSHIVRAFKKAKADCEWPECYSGNEVAINPRVARLPVCGGEVTIKIRSVDEPDYHSDHYAAMEIDIQCSRCKNPWFPGWRELNLLRHDSDGIELGRIVAEHFA